MKKWVRRICLAVVLTPVAMIALLAVFVLIVQLPNIWHVYSYDLQSLRPDDRRAGSPEPGAETGSLPLTAVPVRLREVFLAAEDPDFYARPPYNPAIQLVGGLLVPAPRRGPVFSYELARWALADTPSRQRRSKIEAPLMSYRIEHELNKNDIFAAYLNGANLAPGKRGVAAAARYYFDKSLDDLDLAEMVYLAARARTGPCAGRRWVEQGNRFVLDRMVALSRIDQAQADAAAAEISTFKQDWPDCPSRR